VQGTAQLSDGMGAEYDSQLRHSVDAELISVRYLLLGVMFELPRSVVPRPKHVDWRVGLSFRDEAKLEQQLRGTLEGVVDGGSFQIPVRYDFQSHGLVAFQPRQLAIGAGAKSGPWHAGLDVAWEQWSRYPSPIARSGTEVTADVPAGLPLSLPPNQDLPPPELAAFDDRITVRVGIERSLVFSPSLALALRAGYAYLPTPPVRSDIVGQLLDADQHVFSLGSGLQLQKLSRHLPRSLTLEAHGLWVRLPNKRQTRDRMTFLAKGHALSAGLTLTAAFAP
jgi:long-subunit fatty acid transport protein